MSTEFMTKMQKIIVALYRRDYNGQISWVQDSQIPSLFHTEVAGYNLNMQEYDDGGIAFSIFDASGTLLESTNSMYQSHTMLPELYSQVRYRVLNIEKQIDELLAYLEK